MKKVHYWYNDLELIHPRTACHPRGMMPAKSKDPLLTDTWTKVTCSACLKKQGRGVEMRTVRMFKVCPNCGYGKNPRCV